VRTTVESSIAERVCESRRAQGLPPTVCDAVALGRIVAVLRLTTERAPRKARTDQSSPKAGAP
jgi:hypothetical protein